MSSRDGGMFLSQRHYILDILERAGMADYKPCSTPVDTSAKLSLTRPPVADVHIIEVWLVLYSILLLLDQI